MNRVDGRTDVRNGRREDAETPRIERTDVTVLVPTMDERETIGEVVSGFRTEGFENVLVVDGGSTDGTPGIARDHGARVVAQSGAGKGQAIREGMEYVESEYVLMVDGDGTYRPADADRLLDPLADGYEHVIGDRFADMHPDAMSFLNRAGNRIVNGAFEYIHGREYRDILSGYRAFTASSFDRMQLSANGFGIETEMSVECIKRKIPTTAVPVTYLPRPTGSETNLRPFRDGGIIFLELYRRAKTNNPLFYFGSVGFTSTAIGVGLGIYVGVEWVTQQISHEVIAVVSAFAILFGVQLLMFGVLSDLILSLHNEVLRKIDEEETARPRETKPTAGYRGGSERE